MTDTQRFRTRPVQNELPTNEPRTFRTRPVSRPIQSDVGVAARALGKGVTSIADLPQLIGEIGLNPNYGGAQLARRAINGLRGKPTEELPTVSLGTPVTNIAREAIKNKTGFDLEPRPEGPWQETLAHAAELGGGVIGLNAPSAIAKGGANILNNLFRGVKTGAAIGGVSGAAQAYGGANPLAADLTTAAILPFGTAAAGSGYKAGKNILSRLTKQGQQETANKVAGELLTDVVGKKNIPQVLKNLDEVTPFGTSLTTAELAQNPGLSRIHRAKSPNLDRIAEKNAANDSIIRREISKLGETGLEPEILGTKIRKPIFSNLQKAERKRNEATKPLYENLRKSKEGVKLDPIRKFLNEEKKFAKGENAKALDFIEKGLKRNIGGEGPSYLSSKDLKELGAYINPTVGELDALATAVGDKISAAHKANKPGLKRLYSDAKKALEETIKGSNLGLKHRKEYAKFSEPISKITESNLLNKLVKRDKYNKDFVTAPDLIPDQVVKASLKDTRALVNQVKDDKNALKTIRGAYADKFINNIELSGQNAKGNYSLSHDKIRKFLKNNEAKLNAVFDPTQLKVLREIEDISKRRNFVGTAGRALGSNTQSETTLLEALSSKAGSKLLEHSVANNIPGGKALVSISKATKDYYLGNKADLLQKVLEEALIDPKKAKTLLMPVKDVKPSDFKSIFKSSYKPLSPLVAALTPNQKKGEE